MNAVLAGFPARTDAARARDKSVQRRPRLGFLGVGWIGRSRLEAIAAADCADVVALADRDEGALTLARAHAPHARVCGELDELLALDLDGVVIATPSALHAAQAGMALAHPLAVFCQKPLARTAAETQQVIAAARAADRLLDVDLSYRHTTGMQRIRELLMAGEIGDVYAVDLVFHNAYGPDKPWFRDPVQSGGGCAIDLGIHLVDLLLWTLDFPRIECVRSRLFARGTPLPPRPAVVEDHAIVEIELAGGVLARLACSWNLHAGCDAVIEATFHGTRGGASFRNVNGSFYDFAAERYSGTARTTLAAPPDGWFGRAAVRWAQRLGERGGFDRQITEMTHVAGVVDAIYGR